MLTGREVEEMCEEWVQRVCSSISAVVSFKMCVSNSHDEISRCVKVELWVMFAVIVSGLLLFSKVSRVRASWH